MLFSKRRELAERYKKWVFEESERLLKQNPRTIVKDCPETVIAYLQQEGYLKDKEVKIICLCGSSRFKDAFDEANYQETMKGNIVLSVGFYTHATGNKHGEGIGATPEQKIALDKLHMRKIDLADEILIINVGGYIGESTRNEIAHATMQRKPIKYLEPIKSVS